MNKKEVVCYVHGLWHIYRSEAYFKSIVEPLSEFYKVTLKVFSLKEFAQEKDKIIILLLVPNRYEDEYLEMKKIIESNNGNTYFWPPMWDWICKWDQYMWDKISKKINIISYCKKVSEQAKKYKFNVLDLKYYHPISNKVNFKNGRCLAYWNRTNLYPRDFLLALCRVLNIDKFLYLEKFDPGFSKKFFLPDRWAYTKIKKFENWTSSNEYHNILKESNIFLCSRNIEGIGLSFLEQFSRGSFCLSYNESTMNEYITHKKNGYLLDTLVASELKYEELESLDIEELSKNTYTDAQEGFSNWRFDLLKLNTFLSQEKII